MRHSHGAMLHVRRIYLFLVVQKVLLQMPHTIDGKQVTLKQLDVIPPGYNSEDIDTIVVRGDVKAVGEEALELFFTNKRRCGGGEIVSIKIESDSEAFITFQDPDGMYCTYVWYCMCVVWCIIQTLCTLVIVSTWELDWKISTFNN